MKLSTTQLIILAGLFSCSVLSKANKVRFKYHGELTNRMAIMIIPSQGQLIKITAGGEGQENRYWYKDSSLIYISNLSGSSTLNEPLIKQQERAYNKQFSLDSVVIEGVDQKGSLWKEVKYKGLRYGYSNVPVPNKSFFDKAINSLRIKE